MISDTQTYSWIIRNVFFDAIARDPYFAGFTLKKTRMLRMQRDRLPYIGVYIADDVMTPDGDANAGCVRLNHTLRLGYSVLVAHNNEDIAEQEIDLAFTRITSVLADPYIMNVLDTYSPILRFDNPDNTRIESINRAVRRHSFGASGLDNETAVAELQFDLSCFYREMFEPVFTEDLLEVDVNTGIKQGETPDQMAQRQQVHVKYLFAELRKSLTPPTPQKENDHG